jgi:hypothetical protein
MKAATFVGGVAEVIGFVAMGALIYETPEVDFEVEKVSPPTTGPNTAALAVDEWFKEIPAPERRRGRHAYA